MKHPRTTWFSVAGAAGVVLSNRGRELSPWAGLAGDVLTAIGLLGLGLNTPDKQKTDITEKNVNKLRTESEEFRRH